jgi:predicted secreted protein
MPVSSGSNLRLQISLDLGGTWENIPGEVSSGIVVSNEQVDTTEKTTQATNGMREMVACGVRSAAIQAAGVTKDGVTNTLFNFLSQSAVLGDIGFFRLIEGVSILYSGLFLVQQFARTGEHNGADRYTLSLESSGALASGINIIVPPAGVYQTGYAVSVRKIVDSYTGFCMRVRRSSDNTEQDIPFRNGWLDESVLSSFVGSGDGFVPAWYNQTPQYGAVSFANADVLSQAQIVSSGNIIRSGGSGRPAVLFASTGKMLYAPGGAYWLTASNNGMFMSAVSSSTIGSPGSNTRGLFGQDWPDGNSPAYVGRWFTPSNRAHRVRLDLSLVDIKTDDSSVYPTYPLTDTNISATRSGSVRIYARGALNISTQVTFPDRTGWTLRNTFIGTGAGVTDVKIFEVIAQSQAWSEAYQLDLSKNQMLAFGIPGVY